MGWCVVPLLLGYYLVSSLLCNAVAFVEEPSGGRADGYCGRILRAQTQGTRRDGHHEFRLRVEGDQETYQPGNTYRGESKLYCREKRNALWLVVRQISKL